jgi:hypothetical protein
MLLSASTGCYRVPTGKLAIATVELEGAPNIDEEDLEERITTRASKSILGVYGFIYEYELFDRYALRRDLARIERYMRARGFYDAEVRVARVVPDGNKVHVTIEVKEGRPVTVGEVVFEGDDLVEPSAREGMRSAIAAVLPKGAPRRQRSPHVGMRPRRCSDWRRSISRPPRRACASRSRRAPSRGSVRSRGRASRSSPRARSATCSASPKAICIRARSSSARGRRSSISVSSRPSTSRPT